MELNFHPFQEAILYNVDTMEVAQLPDTVQGRQVAQITLSFQLKLPVTRKKDQPTSNRSQPGCGLIYSEANGLEFVVAGGTASRDTTEIFNLNDGAWRAGPNLPWDMAFGWVSLEAINCCFLMN